MRAPSIAARLPVGPEAAGLARDAVGELDERVPAGVMEDLRLLVSELVTNSVRHARMPASGNVLLEVRLSPSRVRVEVFDRGAGFDPPPASAPVAGRGWGLYLVDAIASRWGSTRGPTSSVWFELDL